ncbi:MAG: hypothetical protein ACI4WW_00240 [Candidatus Coprovivens sp.]
MKLNFKNTLFDITLKPTENKIGLKENDYWYLVTIKINNDEYNNEVTKEMLTNNEINNTINILENYINNNEINKIDYITNYIKLNLLEDKLELTFIEPISADSKKCKVIFNKNEISELINIMKIK